MVSEKEIKRVLKALDFIIVWITAVISFIAIKGFVLALTDGYFLSASILLILGITNFTISAMLFLSKDVSLEKPKRKRGD